MASCTANETAAHTPVGIGQASRGVGRRGGGSQPHLIIQPLGNGLRHNLRHAAPLVLPLGPTRAATCPGMHPHLDRFQLADSAVTHQLGLAVIDGQPLLQANPVTEGAAPQFTLYGNPGTNYFIQYTTSLAPSINWTPYSNFVLTGLQTNFPPVSPSDPVEFFQAYYLPPP